MRFTRGVRWAAPRSGCWSPLLNGNFRGIATVSMMGRFGEVAPPQGFAEQPRLLSGAAKCALDSISEGSCEDSEVGSMLEALDEYLRSLRPSVEMWTSRRIIVCLQGDHPWLDGRT